MEASIRFKTQNKQAKSIYKKSLPVLEQWGFLKNLRILQPHGPIVLILIH